MCNSGIPAVMKLLHDKGLIHGDCLTVTGKTVAENLEQQPDLTDFIKMCHDIFTTWSQVSDMWDTLTNFFEIIKC
jgi:dihydroxyacid dehydratase/phosphogluconate dehydratase